MIRGALVLVVVAGCTLASVPGRSFGQAIPAFSGAEGPGANATGGRGGDVYHVTNLEFDLSGVIPGSLKYGINNAPGAGRTIVFDVGGTIYQNGGGSNWWFRSGKSNITVAGQTAPGGITIAGVGTKWTGNNIVLRNITVRTNKDPVNPNNFTYDGISTQATNSIIDHVSVTWAGDEGISATDAVNNTTVQYALIGEGLNFNGHSFGSILNTQNSDAPMAYHHNLYAHNKSRNPRLGSETGTGAIANFYNNTIYNWEGNAGYSASNADTGAQEPSRTNIVNNFYLKGANNGSTIFSAAGNQTQIYQSGNLYDSNKDGDFNDGTAVAWSHFAGSETQLAAPLAVAGGVIDSATVGRDRALDYGGANWWNRNPIDARVINSVRTGTGGIVLDLATGVQATEWATVLSQQATGGVAPFTRPAGWDADNDGMPGSWETAHGLNPLVADNNGDFDNDGYPNVEEYVNEIAQWPAPKAIVFNGSTNNRYAQITNWDITWQPSRFDTAQLRTGTTVVDAVGQHAGTLAVAPNAGDNATLSVNAGWIEVATALNVGSAGAGVANHLGGLVVAPTVTLGGSGAASGTYNLSGAGKLRVGTLAKGATGGVFNFTGGTLSADNVAFDLVNNGGTISPGDSPGTTRVVGNLSLNSGTLAIEVTGAGAGQFDRVIVAGTLAAGGVLDVTFLGGYAPTAGATFDILDFASASGAFTLDLPALDDGLIWDSSNLLSTGVLSVVAALTPSADFNTDDIVDGQDLLVWQRGLGLAGQTSNADGDADRNGVVNAADLDVWRTQLGTNPAGQVASAAVPEPASLCLIALLTTAHQHLRRLSRRTAGN
jgi:hypothetical protein